MTTSNFQLADMLTDPRAPLATNGLLVVSTTTDGFQLTPTGLDAVTANAEISIGATVATDVRLNGATAGRDVVFDASTNTLRVEDNAWVAFGTGEDLTIQSTGTDSYVEALAALDVQAAGAFDPRL